MKASRFSMCEEQQAVEVSFAPVEQFSPRVRSILEAQPLNSLSRRELFVSVSRSSTAPLDEKISPSTLACSNSP